MTTKLYIRWDGDEPGLAEHRISLAGFGDALMRLQKAMQRCASASMSRADHGSYAQRGGAYRKDAKRVDIQIAAVHAGCARPEFVVTMRPTSDGQMPLVENLPEIGLRTFLDNVERAGRGDAVMEDVGRFLRAVPPTVRTQEFVHETNGVTVRRVSVGRPAPAAQPGGPELSRALIGSGRVAAVGFIPGDTFVTIAAKGSGEHRLEARVEQVEAALALRHAVVSFAAVRHPDVGRLLWIRAEADGAARPGDDERVARLHSRWARTLEILGS